MLKQRIMLTEMLEVMWNRYMRSHNLGDIHGENLHIWAVERKKSFLENWNKFLQKNYTTIVRTYWATKYESKSGIMTGENLHIWAVERKKSFLENWNKFLQKNYTTIVRTYWATKYESKSGRKFWVTCRCLSDACWH